MIKYNREVKLKGVIIMGKQNCFFLFSVVSVYLLLSNANAAEMPKQNVEAQNFLYNSVQKDFFLDAPLNLNFFPNIKQIQVAQVCWIMDTGECLGSSFGWDDKTPGTPSTPPDEYDKKGPQDCIPQDCIDEGYTITNCPDGYRGNKECLYADGYYAECVKACPSGYKKCEPPYYGIGEACDGMYKECQCDYCEGYNYTKDNIPNGYVIDGAACNSCNGERYKVKPNPCDGFLDCGNMGGMAGAKTCQSGNKIKYDNCKPCPNFGKYTSCPACSVCTYEACSNKYYVTGCAAGCTDLCSDC